MGGDMEWTQQNLWRICNNVMYQTKKDKASNVEIVFTWRDDVIIPIIYANPNHRTICQGVKIEEED